MAWSWRRRRCRDRNPWTCGAPPVNLPDSRRSVGRRRGMRTARSAATTGRWPAATPGVRGLLANDMHLGLAVPNTWYRVRLLVASESPARIVTCWADAARGADHGRRQQRSHGLGLHEQLRRLERPRARRSFGGRCAVSKRCGSRPIERTVETVRSSSGATRTVTVERRSGVRCFPLPGRATSLSSRSPDGARPDRHELNWTQLESVTDCSSALEVANSVGGPAQNFVCADAAAA